MSDLVVVVPSRGRPQSVTELTKAFQETCIAYGGGDFTKLVFAVDADDPTVADYMFAAEQRCHWTTIEVFVQPGGTMVTALNAAAVYVLDKHPEAKAIAFLGDDHRPRSDGWDAAYLAALAEKPGLVYGNDLLQGANLPTQVAMSAEVVRALGWMAPPTLVHLAVDNWWLELGQAADCITYLPDVVVEHLHPIAHKAKWDEGYKRVNAPEMYQRDLTEFERLRRTELPKAVEAVKNALAVSR